MRKCAFLTTDTLAEPAIDDVLAAEAFRRLGWAVQSVSWRDHSVDWRHFEVVVIRSTWDYQNEPNRFLSVLETIVRSGVRLINPLELVRWNIRKTYLLNLQTKGIRIVPTISGQCITDRRLNDHFRDIGAPELVIKPVIGAGSQDTYRIRRDSGYPAIEEIVTKFENCDYLAQPFMRAIVADGEYSLFFFGAKFSHAIKKKPGKRDYRVQEEYRGAYKRLAPQSDLVKTAQQVIATVEPAPVYARVDLVRDQENRFAVMELELIEPGLFLQLDKRAPNRFAQAFSDWIARTNRQNRAERSDILS
jgi:hypothetical protein